MDGNGRSGADLNFTADMSERMNVPHHIRFGDGNNSDYMLHQPLLHDDAGSGVSSKMEVPDRIFVSGDNQLVHGKNPPREITLDMRDFPSADAPILLETPPRQLVLGDRHYPTVDEEWEKKQAIDQRALISQSDDDYLHVEMPSHNGPPLAPSDELRLVRKQVIRLATRVYVLEDRVKFQEQRNALLMFIGCAFIGMRLVQFVRGSLT